MRIGNLKFSHALLLPFLLCAGGCAEPAEPAAERAPEAAAPVEELPATVPEAPPEQAPEAARKEATLSIEGTEEPITLVRFTSPPRFPLPFYTYYPEDMVAAEVFAEDGGNVRFTANFGGVLTDDALLEFYVFGELMDEDQARIRTQEVAGGRTPPLQRTAYPWAIETYRLAGQERMGTISLGRHGDRFFYLMRTYPPEFADGFAPRAALILEEWRWKDTNTPLAQEQ